jgi:hypothetical protein
MEVKIWTAGNRRNFRKFSDHPSVPSWNVTISNLCLLHMLFLQCRRNMMNSCHLFKQCTALINHHRHIYVMELCHLLTRSGLTYPEVSSKVCHDSYCHLKNSVSLPWVIYYDAFYLHVVSSFSCIPVICLKLVLFLIPLQFGYLFCNL